MRAGLSFLLAFLGAISVVKADFTVWQSGWVDPLPPGDPFFEISITRSCDTDCNSLLSSTVGDVAGGGADGNENDVTDVTWPAGHICNGPGMHLVRNGAGANVYDSGTGAQIGWCNPSTKYVPCFSVGATTFTGIWECASYVCQC